MRRVGGLALAALLLAAPASAAGGEGGEGGAGLLWPTVNLLILLVVLVYFARKPVSQYFADRRSGISGELDEAAQLKKEAEARFAKWQRRLADLERELAEIRTTARERADTEREHILADARASAERIRRDASLAIEHEVRRARERLRGEASELAVELAAGMLKQQVGPSDRERLLDEFIARVERSPERKNGGAS
jgi:F-type H+-transporting ATPase subunit b